MSDPIYQKVYFPGESMWIEVQGVSEDGRELHGFIRNTPMSTLHDYEQDQLVRCVKSTQGEWWGPAA